MLIVTKLYVYVSRYHIHVHYINARIREISYYCETNHFYIHIYKRLFCACMSFLFLRQSVKHPLYRIDHTYFYTCISYRSGSLFSVFNIFLKLNTTLFILYINNYIIFIKNMLKKCQWKISCLINFIVHTINLQIKK